MFVDELDKDRGSRWRSSTARRSRCTEDTREIARSAWRSSGCSSGCDDSKTWRFVTPDFVRRFHETEGGRFGSRPRGATLRQ